jgi:hypothetical protein
METPEDKLKGLKDKQLYTVPAGYFDRLPERVQARIATPDKQAVFKFPVVVKFALPVVALTIAVVFWMQNNGVNKTQDVQQLLSEIPTVDIIEYLEDSDLSWEDIVDGMDREESLFDNHMDELDTISEEDMGVYLEDYELTGEYL